MSNKPAIATFQAIGKGLLFFFLGVDGLGLTFRMGAFLFSGGINMNTTKLKKKVGKLKSSEDDLRVWLV